MALTAGRPGRTLADASPRPRLHALTSLRWFAALMVFGFHLRPLFARSSSLGWADVLLRPGPVGVSFFFVLSGFVLTWSRRPGDTAGRFLRRRLARIWPNHAATWAAAAAVIVVEGGRISLGIAALNIALVQAWVPRPGVFLGMNSVAWSLSCEAFFYAMFPLLHRRVAGRSLRGRRLLLGALVGWVVLVAVALLPVTDTAPGLAALYVFPPMRLAEFVIGILLAREVADGTLPRIRIAPAAALAGAAYLAAAAAPPPTQVAAVTLVPFMLLIVAAAQASAAGASTVLHRRGLIFLGEISFAMYLVHQLVIRLVERASSASGAASVVVLSVVALGLSVVGSRLLYVRLERPAERALRGGA